MKSRFTQNTQLHCAIIFALMALFVPMSLRAQEVRGKITGKVVDPNKAAVPGAQVKVTDVARNTTVTLSTNDDGLFQANYLLSGTYQVVVEVAGFKKYIQDGVILQINENRELDISLEVGGTTETVTVTAEAANLNTQDGNLGQTIDQKRVEELPLLHGDPYTLIGLSTGVTYTGSARLDRPFEPTHIVGYAFDGTRGNRSDLLIDGAPSTATANANEVIATYVPPSDIVQEFKVQTATFDSQFGNTEGGVTSISIKSGTNSFHGTAYYWLEPGGLAANDFFGNSRGQGRPFTFSNRPGFSVGGPVRIPKIYNGKDKTFFLFGYEGIRDSRPRFDAGNSVYVPTQALRNGNFSGLGVTIYDPLTAFAGTMTATSPGNGCPINTFCRTAFTGNVIPPDRINAVARGILPFFGQPKQSGLLGNIFDSALTEKTQPYDNFTFRIDQNISENNRLFVRGSWYDRFSVYNDYTGTPYAGVNFIFAARQGVIDDVHTFNPTTVLNVRYGYNRFIRAQDQEQDARGFDLTQLGFPASLNNLTPAELRRFPRIDFPANTVLSNGMSNEFRPVGSHSVSAVLNKTLNTHSVKFGTELRIYREDDNFQSNDQTAQFVFDNTYTRLNSASGTDTNGLQALASFLLGYPTTLNIVRRADYSEFSKTWGFFVQDDWRVNSKLTLNLGLRYELETPLVERQNKSVTGFDFGYVQPIQGTAQTRYAALNDPALKALLPQISVTGGLMFAGVDGGSGLYKTPKSTFLPRFGVAYQLNEKTVIRGGFGLFAGFLGERRGDVIQAGYTRTTTAVLTALPNGAPLPFTLSTPFANTPILEPVGNSLGRQTNLGQAISFFNQNPKVSKQARFQIGLQREFGGGWVAEAEFVGNWGYDMEIVRNINALPNRYLNADNSRTAAMNANNSFLGGTVANPFAGLLPGTPLNNNTISRAQLLRPFPAFGDVLATNNDGKSWYYAGQFSLQKRFSKGYTVQASYTKSKWSQATEYLNAADPLPTRMISDQDSPHRIAFSAMYEFPFGRNNKFLSSPNWLSNAIFAGWQVGGTVQLQSGFPIAFGAYNLTTAVTSGDLFYRGGQIDIPSAQRTTAIWFNTSAFQSFLDWPSFLPSGVTPATATAAQRTAAQTAATTAATPVNHLRTTPFRFPGVRRDYIKNVDLTLKKDIVLRETMKVQLRFELLNAFNEPYFPAPVTNQTASNFGQISASNQDNYARRAQVGLKFIF
ncbi:MAG: TonB-dependent receptor domain-containing protein [Pyrinomonadaceae bacterium]